MAPPVITLLGLDDAYRAVDKYGARPMTNAWGKAALKGAQYAARSIRREAPVGATGNLRRSVRGRLPRTRGIEAALSGRMGVALAGPTAPHRHLVIRGHRIVAHNGTFTGRTSKPNPFVDRAVEPIKAAVVEVVKRELVRQLG
jgi:hypothetical protein